jgi:multisubunit Na+/H+ antiporter MnhE subunit
MEEPNKSSLSFTISIAVIAALIQIAIAILTNLLSSGFQTYLPVSQLGFILFALISLAFLVVAGTILQYLVQSPSSFFLTQEYAPVMRSLGTVAFWLGAITSLGIMAYLVWSNTYPKQVDLLSGTCWALSCIWFVSLFPMYIGANFKANIDVSEGWREKKRKIIKHLVARKRLTEDDVKLLIANTGVFGFMEAQKTMTRFAKEEHWATLEEHGSDLVLKIDDLK